MSEGKRLAADLQSELDRIHEEQALIGAMAAELRLHAWALSYLDTALVELDKRRNQLAGRLTKPVSPPPLPQETKPPPIEERYSRQSWQKILEGASE